MGKKILKAIEEAYRKGLKDAKGLNDISPYLLTSQVVAQELANKFCQPDVSGRGEQFYCTCSRAKGLDHDEEGTPYCISCQKEVQ